MTWSLRTKQERRGWYSWPVVCYLRHCLCCLCPYCLSSVVSPSRRPPLTPRVTQPRYPWRGCAVKVFSCKGDRKGQLLEEPRFHSCESSASTPGVCWVVIFFNSCFQWELTFWNCWVFLSSWHGCTMWVSCVNIFSAGTSMDMATELSGSLDLHHLYIKR